MATDNSPPRVHAIFLTAVIAFAILIGLKFVFDSYYVTMFEEEEYTKIGSVQSEQLLQLRANEKRNLTSAPVPIDRAMMLLAKSREEASSGMVDGGVVPQPSNDTGPLIGWGKLPHELTATEQAAPADADGGAMVAGDGGVMLGADGGAVQANAAVTDGGAAAIATNGLPDSGATPKSDAGSLPHP